ncbi:DUF2642 domain-containing protein [Paenibacillus sp. Y412MC10]|uniref:DUF2642 domain-containing protein n=1 Tax=Geobacillus sp. (strain Y412MC10) TaxID=481743 RepID=UPI00119CCC49|nr:DUF2642 domain-containing protein [Paenibacillus sp. Y412MC10]
MNSHNNTSGYPAPPVGYAPGYYAYPPPQPLLPYYAPRTPANPQPAHYAALVEPAFIDHLLRHKGAKMVIMTTAGKVEGILSGVAVDHLQLTIGDNKALHLRLAEVVYFEGVPF